METDVLVIGGGATGGGIAFDLALRGVRVVLAEMGDLATGTSGRYHGLLHSGGRYAVRDLESAKECIDENLILRRVAAQAIEDTGGYFVLCPGDDESYVDQWLAGCAAAGIPTREVPLAEALNREPALNRDLRAIYEVPDGTCDSWDLLHALQAGAEAAGAIFLTYHRVDSFHRSADGRISGARLTNLRDDSTHDITCAVVVSAAGPWAAEVAAQAGAHFSMKLSRGAMMAFNLRWVNTVINKLRKPGDGDIFVPVGTVSVIGTTSVPTDDPADTRVEAWEVQQILAEAEAMTPGISRARILRSWGGVRPLYDPGASAEGRSAARTFTVLDHTADGAAGLLSIVGGKLTTYRLMAERIADMACAQLGVTRPSVTATTPLPAVHGGQARLHRLRGRLDKLEHGELPGALICECEVVTAPQLLEAMRQQDVVSLNDLRRDLRLGMGPCQGGFCAYRAAALRHEAQAETPERTRALLSEFVERRFGGIKPLLWGHNLRQALLSEHIYGRILSLYGEPNGQAAPPPADLTAPELLDASGHKVVVIGAGLAGLMAALTASESGARVELVAHGQGALTLHPGWIETGDVEALRRQPDHPYARAADSLTGGLALLHRVVGLTPMRAGISAIGRLRPVAYAAGGALAPLSSDGAILVVGIRGWRDFYPQLVRDNLRAAGFHAESISIDLLHQGGNFDDWPLDYARLLDTPAGLKRVIEQVRPHVGAAQVIAFPAVLGFDAHTRRHLAEALGCAVTEIPTLPPSVPGLRLYHALRRELLARGARFTIGPRVTGLELQDDHVSGVYASTAANGRARLISADAVIVCTGGLFGGGLESGLMKHVRDTATHLPVAHIPPENDWFTAPLLSGQPQPIHQTGVLTDAALRPLDDEGQPIAANLFAAGRLLSGFSPVVEGSTEGVDIATGHHAARQAVALVASARVEG